MPVSKTAGQYRAVRCILCDICHPLTGGHLILLVNSISEPVDKGIYYFIICSPELW
jgi:hypothetical protein